jgi:hypothetical protein
MPVNQKGSILTGVLILLALLLLVAVPVLQAATVEYRASINAQLAAQAFYLAEAGLAHGQQDFLRRAGEGDFSGFLLSSSQASGWDERELGGSYDATVEVKPEAEGYRVEILSIGTAQGKSVETKVTFLAAPAMDPLIPPDALEWTMHSHTVPSIGWNAHVEEPLDWDKGGERRYTLGDWPWDESGGEDQTVGYQDEWVINVPRGTTHELAIGNLTLLSQARIAVRGGGQLNLHVCGDLLLQSPATIEIAEDTDCRIYVYGNLTLRSQSSIEVAEGSNSRLEMHVRDNVLLNSPASLGSQAGSPPAWLICYGDDIEFRSQSRAMQLAIYAPAASLLMRSPAYIDGVVIVESLQMLAGGSITRAEVFDRPDLDVPGAAGGGASLTVKDKIWDRP